MKKLFLLVSIVALALISCSTTEKIDSEWTYSHHEGILEEKEDIVYVFENEKGETQEFTMITDDDFTLQNKLKISKEFSLEVVDGTIIDLEEIEKKGSSFTPLLQGVPGERTIKNLFSTAFSPVGSTLYVYGGGWNWQDNGAGDEARSIGISEEWVSFFSSQDAGYSFRDERYYPQNGINQIHDKGLDCSGYVGWVIYNIFNTEDGNEGFVGSSTKMARRLSEKGLGEWTQDYSIEDIKPGDIISVSGHVWIALGVCSDSSVIALHSTASESREGNEGGGPELSAVAYTTDSEAYRIADYYMSTYYPEWYERYPIALKSPDIYFVAEGENMGKFSWFIDKDKGLEDPDGYLEMSPEEILKDLYTSR
ncbi:MAG: hypothetical protein ACI4SL_03620 [Candidatus Ornithospirochaeta sp.]